MRPHVEDDIEVSRGPAAHAAFAVAGRAQSGAGVHARRNAHLDFRGSLAAGGAMTGMARFLDDPAGALATRTGLGNAEDAPRADHLAATAAG